MADTQELVPDIVIKLNAAPMQAIWLDDVVSVSINSKVNAMTTLSLKVLPGWNKQFTGFTWIDDPVINEGDDVSVSLGYVGKSTKELFAGEITGMSFEMSVDGAPTVTFNGYDLRHRLKRTNTPDNYLNKKYKDIVQEITRKAGLTASIEGARAERLYDRVQIDANTSELTFLEKISARIGYDVTIEGKKIYFRARGDALKKSAVATLKFEEDLMNFSVDLSSMDLVKAVEVKSWDEKKKVGIVSKITSASTEMGSKPGYKKAISNFGESAQILMETPFPVKAEVDDFAQAEFDKMSLGYVQINGSCTGNTDLNAGDIIKIEGVGKKFSGSYYLDSVTHSYSPDNGYETRFTGRSNATNG